MATNRWVYRIFDGAWRVGFRDSPLFPFDLETYAIAELDAKITPDPILHRYDAHTKQNVDASDAEQAAFREEQASHDATTLLDTPLNQALLKVLASVLTGAVKLDPGSDGGVTALTDLVRTAVVDSGKV